LRDTTSVSYFIRHTNRGPRPERADEQAQVARANNGDGETTDRLIAAHLPGIIHVAKEFRGRGLPFDDLIAEGCVGFLKAIRHYRAVNGTRFMTYASFWIRKEMLSAVAHQPGAIRVPDYARRNGHPAIRASSLDAPKSDNGNLRIEDSLRHPDPSPADTVITEERRIRIRQVLLHMPSRDRAVIVWRFGLAGQPQHTLAEIARKLGLSKERVRQIEVSALVRLREAVVERFPPRARCQNATRMRRAPVAPSVRRVGSR
jgi:RNA polymerase sigma factor (sigma-70 family)